MQQEKRSISQTHTRRFSKPLERQNILRFITPKQTTSTKELVTIQSLISDFIDYNVFQNKSSLQDKVDFYITPYNPKTQLNTSMQFVNDEGDYQTLAKQDWEQVAKFILKTDKKEFRKALGSTNQHLYKQLKGLAQKVLVSKQKNKKKECSSSLLPSTKLRKGSIKNQMRKRFQSKIQQSFENFKQILDDKETLTDDFTAAEDTDSQYGGS